MQKFKIVEMHDMEFKWLDGYSHSTNVNIQDNHSMTVLACGNHHTVAIFMK